MGRSPNGPGALMHEPECYKPCASVDAVPPESQNAARARLACTPALDMRQVDRTALVPYTREQMFALVADIERYPQFVPWVVAAKVLQRDERGVIGQLEMERAGVREKFTTRNVLEPPSRMSLALVDGPFR